MQATNRTEGNMTTALGRARAMGRDHGSSWASYLEETATPEDVPNPLSGEWADEPTPNDILAQFVDSGFDEDDILGQYEEGFYEGYKARAVSMDLWDES